VDLNEIFMSDIRSRGSVALLRPAPAEKGPTPAAMGQLLDRLFADGARASDPVACLEAVIEEGFGALPQPGAGKTLARFALLADVASRSLPLAKLYEAHTDAMAILAELGKDPSLPAGTWGVFAAEAQPPALFVDTAMNDQVVLSGVKDWCSGALDLSHALVTARSRSGQPVLVAVALRDERVKISKGPWAAVGMARTETARLEFNDMPGKRVGEPNDYLTRPGFWQGAIGIAACWYGGATHLADKLHASLLQRQDEHSLAHMGAVVAALHAARSTLIAAAASIDAEPAANQRALALACREIVENACQRVLMHAGRALGAKPFCMDAQFAAMAADLPVFLRQSHAERDLQQLGALALKKDPQWTRFSSSL
jgi:alkylation response protein AidB-like acyl-CoA dehydrogenase